MNDETPAHFPKPFRFGMSELIATVLLFGLEAFVFSELLQWAGGHEVEAIIAGSVFSLVVVACSGFLAARYCATKKILSQARKLALLLLTNLLVCALFIGIGSLMKSLG